MRPKLVCEKSGAEKRNNDRPAPSAIAVLFVLSHPVRRIPNGANMEPLLTVSFFCVRLKLFSRTHLFFAICYHPQMPKSRQFSVKLESATSTPSTPACLPGRPDSHPRAE